MSDLENNETPQTTDKPGLKIFEGKTEKWVYGSYLFLAATLVTWGLVFLRLGSTSVVLHAAIAPSIGALTVAMMFWGLVATLFRPPALQRPRIVGFAILLFVGFVNNVPLFAPPLSTESWRSPEAQVPRRGEVYVIAGGEDRATNYHATTAAYRWATDFTVLAKGKKFALDGKKNEDYACFGRPVVAPLGGDVVDIENDVTDNTPGEVSEDFSNVFGNYVLIKFDDHAYLFIAHMKEGTVRPRIGDRIEQGDTIGACGNSGRSIEPHVHVHAQNTETFPYSESRPLKYRSVGMPKGESKWNAGDGERISL